MKRHLQDEHPQETTSGSPQLFQSDYQAHFLPISFHRKLQLLVSVCLIQCCCGVCGVGFQICDFGCFFLRFKRRICQMKNLISHACFLHRWWIRHLEDESGSCNVNVCRERHVKHLPTPACRILARFLASTWPQLTKGRQAAELRGTGSLRDKCAFCLGDRHRKAKCPRN